MNRIQYKIFIFLFLSLSGSCVFGQEVFTGRVYDKNNNEPLAFVNIVYNSRNLGTTTDLNGRFSIPNKKNIEFLRVSYLGYKTKIIEAEELHNRQHIELFLEIDAYRLDEVIVFPGENPAHRIIKEVKRNADINNPEKMTSFSYIDYSKMIFTVDVDGIETKEKKKSDSLIVEPQIINDSIPEKDLSEENDADTAKTGIERIRDFVDYQHLFISESITERRFRFPDNNKEEVLAHRISGLRNPGFALLVSQLQSFSFYDDFVTILDTRYVNPLSRGSISRYFFLIEDTLYNELADTIFVISFRPGKGRNFDGLQGVMHINSHNYAVQNVRARPYEPSGAFDIVIQQKYELIDGRQWFPIQLNTEIIFNFAEASSGDVRIPIVGIGRSYLSDISLNPEFSRRDFNHIKLLIKDDAHRKDDYFWNKFRFEELTERDLNTYRVIDSLGKEVNLDRYMELLEFLASGYIPFRFLSFDPNQILYYNNYEGTRLGLGVKTNRRLVPWLSVGGYFAYGFQDKAWKYGGETEFIFHNPSDTRLRLGYRQDLKYSDSYSFNKRSNMLSSESMRHFFSSEMDSVTEYYSGLKFNTLRYLSADIVLKRSETKIINPGRYSYDLPPNNNYINTELGFYLRYAYKERFYQTPRGNRLSLGTKYPILFFNFKQGLSIFDGEFQYQKYEAQIYKKFETRWYGDTHITITGGIAEGNPPYSDFYYGEGTFSYLSVNNTFNTMRPHEFISDRFANIFIRHDFGNLLFKTEKWQPRFVIATSAGWGDTKLISHSSAETHARNMNKGYYESGMQINNIYVINFSGLGVGVYYRYGPYSFSKQINNFAFTLTANLVL